MAGKERLSATLSIGSVLEDSVRRNVSVLRAGLDGVGDAIGEVAKRQRELEKQRKVLEREGRSVAALDREYEELGGTLDRLRRKQERLENVSKGVARVSRDAIAVGSNLRNVAVGAAAGATAVGTAVFSVASSTAALGDEVAKTSARIGVGVAPLQELRYAAQRSGVEVDNLDEGLKEVQLRLADAKRGAGPAVEALDELGLSASKLAKMAPEDAIAAIGDALKGVENVGDQVFIADALMGEDGVRLLNLLRQGSDGIARLRREAQATGYVLSEEAARDAETFQDRLLDTQLTLAGLKNTVGAELMPVVSGAMADFAAWARSNKGEVSEFASATVAGLETAVPIALEVARGLSAVTSKVWDGVGAVADLAGGWENLGIAVGVAMGAKTIASIARLFGSVARLGAAVVGLAAKPALFSRATRLMAAKSSADFARVQASASAAAASVESSRRRMQGKAVVGGALGALALSQVPEGEEAQEAMQARNRERIEGAARSAPLLGSLMEAYDAALEWRRGADEAAEGADTAANAADSLSFSVAGAVEVLHGAPEGGYRFSEAMGLVRQDAAATQGVVDQLSTSVSILTGRLEDVEKASNRARQAAGQPGALGLDPRADAARDYPYHPGSSVRAKGQLVPGGRPQARALGGVLERGPALVGEQGPERIWASRAAFVENRRDLETALRMATGIRAGLTGLGRAPAPSAEGGGGTTVIQIDARGMSADELFRVAEQRARRRRGRVLYDGAAGLGQYGAA